MLTDEIKNKVKKDIVRIKNRSPLFNKAKTGTMTQGEFADYLNNLMYFFHHTCIHLDIAKTRCKQLGLNYLIEFYESKIEEEQGHAQWAKDDLGAIGRPQDDFDLSRITPATHRMLAYSVDTINRDPEAYLAYMFFLEYITVLMSPEFLDDMEKKCNIPKTSITAISNHAELDKQHIEDDMSGILDIVKRNPKKKDDIIKVLDDTLHLVEEFFRDAVSIYH